MRGLGITLLLMACGSGGVRLSIDLRTDYAPGIEFERVEVDIGGRSQSALASASEDYLRGVRVADLNVSKGLQEGSVRLYTPRGVLLAERRVSLRIDSRFGTTITVDRNCEDVACPIAGDTRATSCLGGRCVDPLCVTGEEPTCPESQCEGDAECPSEGCGRGRCVGNTCLLESGPCDDGFYCAGTECRVRPVFGDAGVDAGSMIDSGSELCGMSCVLVDQPCALAEYTCADGVPVCAVVEALDSSVVCRLAVGECDVEERCDGTSFLCPADAFRTSVCRASRGPCDLDEVCDGSSGLCPADLFAAGVVCRGAADTCDREEVCTGDSAGCPLDEFEPFGTICSDGSCDGLGACTGCVEGAPCSTGNVCELGVQRCADGACASAGAAPDDTVCRAAEGACDVVETCGGATTCPVDGFEAAGVECRAAEGACDTPEVCTGTIAACPVDSTVPDGESCGTGSGCGPESVCAAGSCVAVDEPSCSVSLQFDGVDDLANLVSSAGGTATYEVFAALVGSGGPVMSVGGWTLSVRFVGGRSYEMTATSGGDCTVMSLGVFDARPWNHIAVWIEGMRLTAFADGTMLGFAPVSPTSADGGILLGTDPICGTAFEGSLANLRVWSRLLPPEELRTNAGGSDPSVTAGLTNWYRMDENTGQRLNDEISGEFGFRGRDATPEENDPAWVPGP